MASKNEDKGKPFLHWVTLLVMYAAFIMVVLS